MLTKTAEKYHYKPRPIDSVFSHLVFRQFISHLDPEGLYFTKTDIRELQRAKNAISGEIKNEKRKFLLLATEIYTKQIDFADSLLQTFKDKPFNYDINDTLVLYDKVQYLPKQGLIKRWKKMIKYYALTAYFDQTDSIANGELCGNKQLSEFQNRAVDRLLCNLKSKYNYEGGLEAYIASRYLKSIASAYDPHSSYFSHTEEQAFNASISRNSLSFGFQLIKNDFGELEINKLVPGSPAWNSNALNEGDVLLTISTAGKFKDFTCISYHEALRFLNAKDIENAEFTVRKKNGKEFTIALRKAETEVQQNLISSFLLKGQTNIGYIYLPTFYTQTNNQNSFSDGSAGDMARELIRLKRENISGLIIDLRNNGGGALKEAVLMAGLFINHGAIGIVKTRNEDPQTLKDMNRGTIYKAPLIILVNEFTASAAELFAAALQDYNRAIIVGSQTNGKSSMQTIMPLNAYQQEIIAGDNKNTPASLKLTIGAFYRVDGSSFQKEGIDPDISLPTIYDSLNVRESAYLTALQPDSVNKKTYFYPSKPLPINELQSLSKKHVLNDTTFSIIKQRSNFLSEKNTNYNIPLNQQKFNFLFQQDNLFEIPDADAPFAVENPAFLKGVSSLHDATKEIYEDNMNEIQKDIYIKQAYLIMCDYINSNKPSK
ncbi:MAG: carboxy terminal-processing peptidase [Bacteroidales bacterium]